MEREIELINEIIANAIIHGGDSGGPYESNLESLVIAINNWLCEKGLKDKYHVIQTCYDRQKTDRMREGNKQDGDHSYLQRWVRDDI